MTPQDCYLQHLETRFDAMFQRTKSETDRFRPRLANNRNAANLNRRTRQLVFTLGASQAEGSGFTDLDGNAMLDITMGFGVHLFGHQAPFIEEAIQSQRSKGTALGPLFPLAHAFAETLCTLTGHERCALFNSGTEAVMVAMRVARAITGRSGLVIFDGCYHGTADALLAQKRCPDTQRALATVPGVPQPFVDQTFILDYGEDSAVDWLNRCGEDIACVLVEPVQSRHPEKANGPWLAALRKACDRHGIVLIFDEIITGFRTENGGAARHFNVRPDLATYGKVAGGGQPVGIVAGPSQHLALIDGGVWSFEDDSLPSSPTTFVAGTFNHHPTSMAAGLAALRHLQAGGDGLQRDLNQRTTAFVQRMNQWFTDEGIPVSLVHFSSLFRFVTKGWGRLLYSALLKECVYIWEGRNCFFSSVHSEADIQRLEHAIRKCALELLGTRWLNRKPRPEAHTAPLAGHPIEGAIVLDRNDAEVLMQEGPLELAVGILTAHMPHWTVGPPRIQRLALDEDLNSGLTPPEWTGEGAVWTVMAGPHQVVLHVGMDAALVDGSSLTLCLAEAGRILEALHKGQPLPLPRFDPLDRFANWAGQPGTQPRVAARPAVTHVVELPPGASPTTQPFEDLLAAVAEALDRTDVAMGVPVAGQWMARSPRAIGPCTRQVPWHPGTPDSATPLPGPEAFLEAWRSPTALCDVAFNVDNLTRRTHFGPWPAQPIPVREAWTRQDLVINLLRTPTTSWLQWKVAEGAHVRGDIHHVMDALTLKTLTR